MKIHNILNIRLHLITDSHLFPACVMWQVAGFSGIHTSRTFQTSSALGVPNLRHPLIWRVDWTLVQAGQYAVVDPETPLSILYLTKKEYLKLVGIALSTDSTLIVLASPYDSRPKDEVIEAPKPENSPPVKTVGHAIFWRGMLSRMSRSYRAFLSKGSKMFNSAKLPMYLSGLVKRWSMALGHWAGLPLTTQTWFKDIIQTLPHLQHVLKVQGTTGLVLRLKNSMLLIQRYLAKSPGHSHTFGHPVALANGLPRWIPLGGRNAIRMGSHRAIRFWLSVCYLYKVIEMPHKILNALKSIQQPPFVATAIEVVLLYSYRRFLRLIFVPKFLGGVREIPEEKSSGVVFAPVSAGPNGAPAINKIAEDAAALTLDWDKNETCEEKDQKPGSGSLTSDSGTSVLYNICRVANVFWMNLSAQDIFDIGRPMLEHLEERRVEATCPKEEPKPVLHSRVHVLGEPAGKLRPIAIMDLFTQRVLKPLHDDIYKVLKTLPQDGTHSQSKLMAWLKDHASNAWSGNTWSSLDISSATDSIPTILYKILLEELYGGTPDAEELASACIDLMTDRDFTVTVDKSVQAPAKLSNSLPATVRYTRGQPMGCLGSFALLALWNHSWVQFASWLVTGRVIFSYGITGDDVVISERNPSAPIGDKYVSLSNYFGIGISKPKSFVSSTLFNFLSRIWYGGLEVSPASLREDMHVRDTSSRVQRSLRLLERDWWNASGDGWLAKAVKQFLYPAEYLIAMNHMRKGKLDGLGLRAVLGFMSPTRSISRAFGLSFAPINGWLSAFAGSTSLLARGELVRSNTLFPSGSKSSDLYYLYQEFADCLLRRIAEIGHRNSLVLGQYRTFVSYQVSGLMSGAGRFFLPTAADYLAKRTGDARWLYPAIEQGYNTVGLVSRLGDQWWLPQNIESSILKLFQWLEEFPQARDYSDYELFSHQASLWQATRMTGEREFNQTERHMLSLLYLITQTTNSSVSLQVNPRMADYLERRFLDKMLGSTVGAGVE